MNSKFKIFVNFAFLLNLIFILSASPGQKENQDLDEKVKKFLKSMKHRWYDMNIPESDGKVLYDIIIKNGYKKVLEVGTSTGHSTIWIAWALSKTGGKLITIEINEMRYKRALENFKEAGLQDYIDARLADAHKLVPELKGPFDFIFIDADKNWYKNYLKLLLPKLEKNGCFTAHNVLNRYMYGIKDFLDYLKDLPYMETTIVRSSRSGISVSYKKYNK
ncbi:methyltransferase [candidate division KSB1 bacterium]|nr:MAG: methyltransferase [candidate division KSB1 bacterium]